MNAENSSDLLEEIAADVLLTGEDQSLQGTTAEIEAVKLADVQAVSCQVMFFLIITIFNNVINQNKWHIILRSYHISTVTLQLLLQVFSNL